MAFFAGQELGLVDGAGRQLGSVRVREVRGDVLTGSLTPGPAYSTVEPVFREWVECVNDQLFTEVDRLDGVIRSLRLRVQAAGGSETPVDDFQPGDGVVTLRVEPSSDRNGSTLSPAEGRLSEV